MVIPRLIFAASSALAVSLANYAAVYCAPSLILYSSFSEESGKPVSASMKISGIMIVISNVSGSRISSVIADGSAKMT